MPFPPDGPPPPSDSPLPLRGLTVLAVEDSRFASDALNLPSRRAAARLGFSFEGVFRQHLIVKDRNRDTAWFSVIDSEWPALSRAFTTWLAPANFDAAGRQRSSLSDLTRPLRACDDPALHGQTG